MATSVPAAKKPTPSRTATAPLTKKPPRRGKVLCGVCQGPIVDGKDEALLCEGKCGLWYHRGCASTPPCSYKELSNSDEPFVCLSCANIQLKQEILLLKNELNIVAELRDMCTALTTEVSSLRNALDSLKGAKLSSLQPPTTGHTKQSYAKVAKTRQAPRSTAPNNKTKRTETSQLPSVENRTNGPKEKRSVNHDQSRPKVKVDGARRIWNTIPTCSAKAVALTISKLIPTKLDLRVKRKTKSMPNNAKSVWWFVVHGTEYDLTILERDWDKIHQQTLWSLQSCYMSPSSVLPNTENVSTINVPTINSCSDSPLATTPENENENPPAHGSSFLEEVPTPPPLQPLHK